MDNKIVKKQNISIKDIEIPMDEQAEQAAIGALIDGAWQEHIGAVNEDWFNGLPNLDILRAINALTASGVIVTVETVVRELKTNAVSQVQNWFLYIDECLEKSAAGSMFEYWRCKLVEVADDRKWHNLMLEIAGKLVDGETSQDFADELTNDLMKLLGESGPIAVKPEPDRIEECFAEVVELSQGKRKVSGLQIGFPKLDAMLQGLQPGNVLIVGARPSVGKSAFAFEVLLHMVEQGIPVGLFSLEMRFEDFIRRAFANLANLSMSNVRNGSLTPQEIARLQQAKDRLKAGPLFVDDLPKTIPQMRAKARLWTEFKGVKCVIVDYLQLCKMGGKHAPRYEEMCDVSQNIKQMAMELGIPVIALSQFNRESEKSDRPTLTSLKDCGQIEQDADAVILLHRFGAEDDDFSKKQIKAYIDKNRQGRTGEVCLVFDGRFQRFREQGHAA
jgi:replicative DNA helicase